MGLSNLSNAADWFIPGSRTLTMISCRIYSPNKHQTNLGRRWKPGLGLSSRWLTQWFNDAAFRNTLFQPVGTLLLRLFRCFTAQEFRGWGSVPVRGREGGGRIKTPGWQQTVRWDRFNTVRTDAFHCLTSQDATSCHCSESSVAELWRLVGSRLDLTDWTRQELYSPAPGPDISVLEMMWPQDDLIFSCFLMRRMICVSCQQRCF